MDADRLTDEERTGVLVVFGAFDSNVLCGVCGMTNEGHITMLYVHPQYLRRGIGKKLLERVRIYARMRQAHAGVCKCNAGIHGRLFQACGL